jgi:hypothetical protein
MKLRKHLPILIFVGAAVFFILHQSVREHLDAPTRLAYAENEGSTINITAPSGKVIDNVLFASYGNPTGSGGDFQKGSCHASTSESVVRSNCVGKSSCSISATNSTFGDPCNGTGKRMYITVTASAPGSSTTSSINYPPKPDPISTSTTTATSTSVPTSSTNTEQPLTAPPPDNTKYIAYGIIGATVLVMIWGIYSVSSMSSPVAPVVAGRRR